MSRATLQPASMEGFREAVRAAVERKSALQICGAQSKYRATDEVELISTSHYAGIVDHQASDFTITTRAGTKVQTVHQTLQAAGQHLPFDPVCVDRGATVGGLVAAGLNGPCRLKHGGIRDFVIGCQYIDGNGIAIRAGGRVVKNAAGFDLPKFLIGSAGRFGLLTEVTFKVFPRPRLYRTFRFPTKHIEGALHLLERLPVLLDWEAIEVLSDNVVLARVGAESQAVLDGAGTQIASNALGEVLGNLAGEVETIDEDASLWAELSNLRDFEEHELLVKIPLQPARIQGLDQAIADLVAARRYSAAGNSCLASLDSAEKLSALDVRLERSGFSGQVVVGPSRHNFLGNLASLPFLRRVKRAMDPHDVFGSLDAKSTGAVS